MGFPAAVVTYMGYSGLGVARALGRRGVRVYAIDPEPDSVAMSTRYCTPVLTPDLVEDEAGYLRALLALGRSLPDKPVLFPTGDAEVMLFSREREAITERYHYLAPAPETVHELLTKDGLARLTARHGVPAPFTLIPEGREAVERAAGSLPFPVLVKPTRSDAWKTPAMKRLVGVGTKVLLCETPAELLAAYEHVAAVDSHLLVQEYIPGGDDRLVYVCAYVGRSGETLGLFVGRKRRVLPPGRGSASFVETIVDPAAAEAAQSLLSKVEYRGPCGVELKLDARDGIYKVIEVNVRTSLWDALGTRSGVDLATMAYRDALGLPVARCFGRRPGPRWISMGRDLPAFRLYRQQGLTTGEWLRSLVGHNHWAVFAWDDPQPFLAGLRDGAGRLLRRARKAIA